MTSDAIIEKIKGNLRLITVCLGILAINMIVIPLLSFLGGAISPELVTILSMISISLSVIFGIFVLTLATDGAWKSS